MLKIEAAEMTCLRSVRLLKLPHTDIHNTEYVHDWEEDQNTGDWLNKLQCNVLI